MGTVLPLTRPRQSSALRTAAIVGGTVAVMYFAREILIPLALAITLTLVLSPAVAFLQKLHFRRFPAALLVVLVALATAGSIGYVIFNELLQVVNALPSYRQNIDNKIQALRAPNKGALARAAESVKELGKELSGPPAPVGPPVVRGRVARNATAEGPLPVQVIEPPANDLTYLRDVARPFLGPLSELGIVLVFTIFLLVEEADLRSRLFRLAGVSRLNVMTQAIADGTQRVSRYLLLQFLVNSVFGTLCALGMYLIGLPYAALWGAVAALLRIVPYAGSIVAGSLPLLLSLAVFDGWRSPLMVLGVFLTLELVTGNFIEPLLYGSHTGISSMALLLATIFWATLWGPAGLILATPLTVCVVVLGRHVPHLSFLHILLGDQPVLEPDAHLYQRLLAMDEHEARAVAEQYRTEHSLAQLYDSVIIPAVTMAERDRHKGALDPEREEFLFLTVREMMADFAEKSDAAPPCQSARVLCFPAYDEADEIAASMLTQLLEQAGCPTILIPLGFAAADLSDMVQPMADDVFCVSAVQPLAFSHARAMTRELKTKFPRTRVVVGVWGFTGGDERALARFRPTVPDQFVTSLSQALESLGVPAQETTPESDQATIPAR